MSPHYYEISDKLFKKILKRRLKNKKTFEELSNEFKIGVTKLRNEFKIRNINVNKIR